MNGFQINWLASILCVMMAFSFALTSHAQDQEDAVEALHLYLFTMPVDEIEEMAADGFSRAELSTLQEQRFVQSSLLPEEEPAQLEPGEAILDLAPDQLEAVRESPAGMAVVFLFELRQPTGSDTSVEHRSYALIPGDEGEEETLAASGEWRVPGSAPAFRLLDYRFGYLLQYTGMVYEVTIERDGQEIPYSVQLNLGGA